MPRARRPAWRRQVLGCAVLALLVASCSSPGTSVTTVTYVGVAGGTITLGMTQTPTGCNPNTVTGATSATRLVLGGVLPSTFTVNQVGMTAPNPNLIVQSELINTKPETIVYTLNPKAVWSDGVAISAADFIYAWTQQRANPIDAPPTVPSVAGYKDIGSVTGSNHGHTVTVVFKTPFADWQMLFANMLPAHVMERVGWNPNCSTVDPAVDISGGPFEISAVSNQSITLSDNPAEMVG